MSTLKVGVIGLGRMGNAFAKHLIAAGFEVAGFDVVADAVKAFEDMGGTAKASPGEVAAACNVVITSLPSVKALQDVVAEIKAKGSRGLIVIETGTLSIADKLWARDELAGAGITLLDCPVSGTAAQAQNKDLVLFASGEEAAVEKAREAIEGFARAYFYLGEFGNGMRMKFVANHLVAIHNAAAGEAMALARKSGLDPQVTLDVIASGAGTSRMWEIRGPMMVKHDYPPAMSIHLWRKDEDLIEGHARSLNVPIPLFTAAEQLYSAARARGYGEEDTGAVHRIFEEMAGMEQD